MGCWKFFRDCFHRWMHPKFPIDDDHQMMNPLLSGSDCLIMTDDEMKGSLVFLEEKPEEHPSEQSYSDFLMRNSVIDQQLAGVNQALKRSDDVMDQMNLEHPMNALDKMHLEHKMHNMSLDEMNLDEMNEESSS